MLVNAVGLLWRIVFLAYMMSVHASSRSNNFQLFSTCFILQHVHRSFIGFGAEYLRLAAVWRAMCL
jgi:hypothetical protein